MDVKETREKIRRFGLETWLGPENYKDALWRDLRHLADDFGRELNDRLNRQRIKAEFILSKVASVVRWADKEHNTGSDDELIKNGFVVDAKEKVKRAELAAKKSADRDVVARFAEKQG